MDKEEGREGDKKREGKGEMGGEGSDSASHCFELVLSWHPHSAQLSLQCLNSSTLMPFALFAIFRFTTDGSKPVTL